MPTYRVTTAGPMFVEQSLEAALSRAHRSIDGCLKQGHTQRRIDREDGSIVLQNVNSNGRIVTGAYISIVRDAAPRMSIVPATPAEIAARAQRLDAQRARRHALAANAVVLDSEQRSRELTAKRNARREQHIARRDALRAQGVVVDRRETAAARRARLFA